jgi:hypothetical protein
MWWRCKVSERRNARGRNGRGCMCCTDRLKQHRLAMSMCRQDKAVVETRPRGRKSRLDKRSMFCATQHRQRMRKFLGDMVCRDWWRLQDRRNMSLQDNGCMLKRLRRKLHQTMCQRGIRWVSQNRNDSNNREDKQNRRREMTLLRLRKKCQEHTAGKRTSCPCQWRTTTFLQGTGRPWRCLLCRRSARLDKRCRWRKMWRQRQSIVCRWGKGCTLKRSLVTKIQRRKAEGGQLLRGKRNPRGRGWGLRSERDNSCRRDKFCSCLRCCRSHCMCLQGNTGIPACI